MPAVLVAAVVAVVILVVAAGQISQVGQVVGQHMRQSLPQMSRIFMASRIRAVAAAQSLRILKSIGNPHWVHQEYVNVDMS